MLLGWLTNKRLTSWNLDQTKRQGSIRSGQVRWSKGSQAAFAPSENPKDPPDPPPPVRFKTRDPEKEVPIAGHTS